MGKENTNNKHDINRRKFLKVLGGGTAVTAAAIYGCGKKVWLQKVIRHLVKFLLTK
jgi:hypothetical protein